jgi:broad specificity phosphatase PhoE
MALARFYVIRHGQKAGKVVTAFGLEQLSATSDEYFQDITFDAAFCSDQQRTQDSVRHILDRRDQRNLAVDTHPAFAIGPRFSEDSIAEFDKLEKELVDPTVQTWMDKWSGGNALREDLRMAMCQIAADLQADDPGHRGPFEILIGYHGPLATFAAPNPKSFPGNIGTADVIVYELEPGDQIARAIYLPCPLPVPPT